MSASSTHDAATTIDTTSSWSNSYTLSASGSESSIIVSTTTDPASSLTTSTEPSILIPTSSSETSVTETSTTGTSIETSAIETSTTTTSSVESSPTAISDQCLEALTLQGDNAVTDCSTRLIITVTPPASTVTETATTTVSESTVDSTLFTETVTTTVLTETSLFTTSTTTTASTEVDTVAEQATVFTTTTSFYTAPTTVTTTVFNYQGSPGKARGLTARQTASPEVPEYAATACASWSKYVSACQQIGVETSTITVEAVTETVTQYASTTATITWSTESSTQTDVVSVTATVSSTQTDVESITVTTTTTETATITSVETILSTTTPTSVVPFSCQATGLSFRARNPFPDGSTRYMNTVNSVNVAWQTFPSSPSAAGLATSTWVLNTGGYLGLASNAGVAYVQVPSSAASLQVKMGTPSAVAAGVAAGTFVQVAGCIDQATSSVNMVAAGRSNMLSCGNALYLSTGTGTDIRSDCVFLAPTAVSA
ncbi:hypothetical protein E8E14_007379 [Neopestalotiopsis sp. 37M]|nr:hypothetical protein E8E14_007379 [Neopestalotiopsis sp. 37M]